MLRILSKSIFLLVSSLIVICGIYPLTLWVVGKTVFPFQAEGSMLIGPDGKIAGSKLIAQSFTKEAYFHSRPSACAYDSSASASSALAASNYLLRDRISKTIGPIAKYKNGQKKGQLIGIDVENWFFQDQFQGKKHIVSQWADLHKSLAENWVAISPLHGAFVEDWAKKHPDIVSQFIKEDPAIQTPKAKDLAVVFFKNFSQEYPGKFPIVKSASPEESNIVAIFFDMWRQDHPDIELEEIPADYVMTSGSGLDPHITLQNALFQLDRVSEKWASHLKREPRLIRDEIVQILNQNAQAPLGGFAGEKFVNVLEVNLALNKRYGSKPL